MRRALERVTAEIPKLWYKTQMTTNKSGGWVVYVRRNGEFIFLTKFLKTKKVAEKERQRLEERQEHRASSIGVGFVRTAG
jgi:hypothetical protein